MELLPGPRMEPFSLVARQKKVPLGFPGIFNYSASPSWWFGGLGTSTSGYMGTTSQNPHHQTKPPIERYLTPSHHQHGSSQGVLEDNVSSKTDPLVGSMAAWMGGYKECKPQGGCLKKVSFDQLHPRTPDVWSWPSTP